MILKEVFTIWAFGIIKDEKNRVLLCLRNDIDFWNLPGGGLKKWESPWEWVIREVKEETWYDVEIVKLIGIYNKPEQNDIVFSFECRIIWWERKLNAEARDIQFFDLNEIPDNTIANHIERIQDFFKNEKKLIMKNQYKKN